TYFITVCGLRQGAVFCDFVFVQTGQNQTLSPGITNKMDTILWKHINNKVVEYENGNIEWYRFKGKALFNKETGNLTLLRVDATYEGTFEYEIQALNFASSIFKYCLKEQTLLSDAVSKPKCSMNPPVRATFEWTGPDGFTYYGDNITITKNGTLDSIYFCHVKNEVSQNFTHLLLKDCFSGNGIKNN
uniref:Ig-like domain-containing protein n=1 Tax=Electrophorus electricus TaxID=8005 RepID=A0AAY5EEL3_ELEEL